MMALPVRAQDAPVTATASASPAGSELTLGNGHIAAVWRSDSQGLRMRSWSAANSTTLAVNTSAFMLTLENGAAIRSDQTLPVGPPTVTTIQAEPGALRKAERFAGKRICQALQDTERTIAMTWCAEMRDGGDYVRTILTITATSHEVPLRTVQMIDARADGMQISGVVKGSPLVAGDIFLGLEDPAAETRLSEGRGRMFVARTLPLKAGNSISYSAVIGATAPGQLRRGFLAYLERERARPYQAFLHYNSWYDIGFFNPYDEADARDAITGVGEALVAKRGVKLDSYLFDDGWDDLKGRWQFHRGFPDGFAPLRELAAHYGAAPGVWLSPWGGYDVPFKQRTAAGKALGFEVNASGFILSGPKYYALFRQVGDDLLTRSGVNQFKIDGTGSAGSVYPGAAFDSDFQAAISLIGHWRTVRPGLFINLTTGTYPSPFWLRYADSIWRGGEDHGFLGVGSWRQRWITYRDAATYDHVVSSGPMFPLNSLMLHGLIFAAHAEHLDAAQGHDFADEVKSYFGSGTQLQEMYISHKLLGDADWNAIAQSALWARANGDTLVDTHWVGGDPAHLDIYGWGAWSPRKGILTLRNPSDRPQTITVTLAKVWELSAGAEQRDYAITWPLGRPSQPGPDRAGGLQRITLRLAPFEVLVLEGSTAPSHAYRSMR